MKKGQRSVDLLVLISSLTIRQTPPSPTEWVTIRRYSHRIRELSIDPRNLFSRYFLRATSLHPSLLVPNLKALKWSPSLRSSSLSIIFIQRLLNPSLVSLNVTVHETDDVTLQSFLANLPFLCPILTIIVINNTARRRGGVSHKNTEVLSRAIPHHEHLECLDISIPVDDVALTHIAMSPKLKNIALVHHPDKSKLHRFCFPSDATPFRNVEYLSLDVWDLSFVTTLLRNQDQMFRSFALCRHSTRPTTEAVFALFTALASRQRTRSLRSISLKSHMYDVDRFASAELDELAMGYHLTHDTFRPLTSLCHLRELCVDIGCWFSIDDDDLLSLTRNWPLLHVLHLNCKQQIDGHIWRTAKYVTFEGLLSLLERCPHLHDLCLPLDARVPVPVSTGDVICNPALTRIHFPNSPISDPRLVEEILARHFPTVETVDFLFTLPRDLEDRPDVETYVALWNEVNTFLFGIHFPASHGGGWGS